MQGTAAAQDGKGRGGRGETENEPPPAAEGGTDGESIYSQVEYDNSEGDTEPPGVVESLVEWEPPPCWYEPRTASQARDYVQGKLGEWQNIPDYDIGPSRDRLLDHFVNGDPYTDYNLGKEDEGAFWFGVINPSQRDHPQATSCSGLPEWVENGETPDNGELLVSSEVLARAAYEWLPLPETEVSLNPGADVTQTVNLPTWIWQDVSGIGEVSATARLASLGLEATTVATPSALTIEPGTGDAVLHPEDGECEINADGTIGEPYSEGRGDEEPPCGVTYLRSTRDGQAFELTATITWSVSWTGTGVAEPQGLPSAVLESTHRLTVDEIQAVVR